MCPSVSWSIMIGRNVRTPWMTPIRFTPSTQRQSSRVLLQLGNPLVPTPALLQTTWTAPYLRSVSFASASTCSAFETSVTTPCTSAPASRRAAVVSASGLSSTSLSTTRMPACTNVSHMPRPMPLAAPVTTATFPFTSLMMASRRLELLRREALPAVEPYRRAVQHRVLDDRQRHPRVFDRTPHALREG